MEWILLGAIPNQMKHMIGKIQHRFNKGKYHLTNVIAFYDKVTILADVGREVDTAFLDFFKAFHRISLSLAQG